MQNLAGMIDLDPHAFAIRKHINNIANQCFVTRGSVEIDTPVLELFSTVDGLYGGDFSKQVFMLDDEYDGATNKSILRYDLTVPLCRYVSAQGLRQFRRHQTGKVYRKDRAQLSKGRYREFYQTDFDIVGSCEENIYDVEMIDTLCDCMNKLLGLENVTIKINHREIVNALLNFAQIENCLRQTVCSILDRLDKVTFTEVKNELLSLVGESCTELLEKIYLIGSFDEICLTLNLSDDIVKCMRQILSFKSNLVFDSCLIRGMDYYTGIIFEVKYANDNIMQFTIAAGGRYDNMIELFNGIKTPAIGMSLGIERIARILEQTTMKKENVQPNLYDIYVATVCKAIDLNITMEQLAICSELRCAGYRVKTSHIKEQKFKRHFDNVFSENIKYMVILGDNELQNKTISIKNIETKEQLTTDRGELVNYFKQHIN